MTIPTGPISGGKFSVVGTLLFIGAAVGLYFLFKKIFREEVVITDAAGNTTKIGEVKTSFGFGKSDKAATNTTQTTNNAATNAATPK